jgi:hypothetical protein
MASFTPTRFETLEDQRLYLDGRLVEIACLDCLGTVRVQKNSDHHTSIQWSAEALEACQEFARRRAEPAGRPVHESCSRLRSSIERAVREGAIEVGGPDG